MESIIRYINWPVVFGFAIAYYISLALYRLFLHPIARFPGPRLAAISRWYEGYYDVIKGGQYTLMIAEMHKKYGPIVRISPHELHVSDPTFYDTIYRNDGRWNKYAWTYDAFGATGSTVFGTDHDAHKAHRRSVAPYFSRPNITAREHLLLKNCKKLCERISNSVGTTLNLGAAISAIARDNANNYIVDKDYKELEQEDFGIGYSNNIQGIGTIWRTTKHLPWFGPALRALPVSLMMKIVDESTRNFLLLYLKSEQDTRDILQAATFDSSNSKEHPTIVHAIVQSNLPPADKAFKRIFDEVTMVLGAAFETTASALRLILFHVYANPAILQKLRNEIATIYPDPSEPLSWKKLEQLPYFTAVLMEGMRLSPGIATRMARITDKDLFYENWRIPAGTPVGMTTILIHTDEKIYPDPMRFDPDRWVKGAANAAVNPLYAPFARGTRVCLGMYFAWAQMYLVVATLVQRFDFTVKDAVASDFEMISDAFGIGIKAGYDLFVDVAPCDG